MRKFLFIFFFSSVLFPLSSFSQENQGATIEEFTFKSTDKLVSAYALILIEPEFSGELPQARRRDAKLEKIGKITWKAYVRTPVSYTHLTLPTIYSV